MKRGGNANPKVDMTKEFISNILPATFEGQVLRLNHPLEHPKAHMCAKPIAIFIRDIFPTQYQSSFEESSKPRGIMLGTEGVGKTLFVFYCIFRLKDEMEKIPVIYVHENPADSGQTERIMLYCTGESGDDERDVKEEEDAEGCRVVSMRFGGRRYFAKELSYEQFAKIVKAQACKVFLDAGYPRDGNDYTSLGYADGCKTFLVLNPREQYEFRDKHPDEEKMFMG